MAKWCWEECKDFDEVQDTANYVKRSKRLIMQSTNFKISTSPHQVVNSCLLIRNVDGQINKYAFVSKGSHDVQLNPCI